MKALMARKHQGNGSMMKTHVETKGQHLSIMYAEESRPLEDLIYWYLAREGIITVPLAWRLAEIPYHLRNLREAIGLPFVSIIQKIISR